MFTGVGTTSASFTIPSISSAQGNSIQESPIRSGTWPVLASFVRAGRAAGSRCQNWKISGTGGNVAASASSQGTQTEPSGGGAVGVTEHQAE